LTNLLGTCEAEEQWEKEYVADLVEQERKKTERLLNKALSLSRKGELKAALIYGRRALKEMRKSGR